MSLPYQSVPTNGEPGSAAFSTRFSQAQSANATLLEKQRSGSVAFTPDAQDKEFSQAAGYTQPRPKRASRWSFSSANRPEGLKTFSGAWWSYHWKLQTSGRRRPRLLYALAGLLLLVVWIGISVGFGTTLQSAEAGNSTIEPPKTISPGYVPDNGVEFFLNGQLNTFDPHLRNLNIQWTALMIQGPLGKATALKDAQQVPVTAFGNSTLAMFANTVSVPDLEVINNSTVPLAYRPFRLKSPLLKPIGYLGISEFDSVSTDIGLSQSLAINAGRQPEFAYPFDLWFASFSFVAANNDTITRTGRPGAAVQRIYGAALTDSILNFKVISKTESTCVTTDTNCELVLRIWVERTNLVKFSAIIVFLISWIVTIAIFLITGEALLVHRLNILEGTDILAICLTALFALPSVRSMLPGVPDYGCLLDMIGILPNVIIITLCTTFFAASRLRMRARQKEEADAEEAQTKNQ